MSSSFTNLVSYCNYQHGAVASGERVQPAYGNADFRHERVPGAERPTGI